LKIPCSGAPEDQIIEKIDIGESLSLGLLQKYFADVVIVPSRDEYDMHPRFTRTKKWRDIVADRKEFARKAFATSSYYDTAIFNYFSSEKMTTSG
jgi:phosphoribosylaminoimidazolecarboxamide formyltransferase/IMP cyclohydrolase